MIDIVIYWVDGNDLEWQKEYSNYKQKAFGRFRDLGTLKYVFRGIEKYMPWVRYVHFITNGQKPDWMNFYNEKLKFHTHQDIFYFKDALPVFNSSAIEANFFNIPDLAEKFILFNDDMLVLKDVPEERFFVNELPVDFLKISFPRKGFIYERLKKQNSLACRFINNSYNFIDNNLLHVASLEKTNLINCNYTLMTNINNYVFSMLKKIYWIQIYHHPQAHLKSTWDSFVKKNINGVVKDTIFSRFRSHKDINQYVYRFINLLEGKFYPQEYKDHLSLYVKNKKELEIRKKNIFDYTFLCICEDEMMTENEFYDLKNYLSFKLSEIFPEKSTFEK